MSRMPKRRKDQTYGPSKDTGLKRILAALLLLAAPALAQPTPPFAAGESSGLSAHLNSAFSQYLSLTPGAAPTGAPTPLTPAAVAAQQGVLLDAFLVAGDADDTASMTRAVAAGVPILLGPRTYSVKNFVMAGTPARFSLKGVPGSVIQRASASGSQFFQITATNVTIDGVTFDMNKAAVTANQWGVFLGAGGQTISIRNSTFKNNSGSLGTCLGLLSTGPAAGGSFILSNVEITGCTFNPLYLASVSNGTVTGSYIHDNSTSGVFLLANGTASASNYSTNIVFSGGNRFVANAGAGLAMGSFAPPYVYGNPAATNINVNGNLFLDNTSYQLNIVNTDHVTVGGNILIQSSSSVTAFGGIDCNAQHLLIEGNDLAFPDASYGIDCGAANEATIRNNNINMGARGAAIDIGGAQNSQVTNNHINITGTTAVGVIVYDVETDGSVRPFPYHASNIAIQNNDIIINGTGAQGVYLLDNPGGFSGALPIYILGNRFTGLSSAAAGQDITYYAAGTSLRVSGNTHNGQSRVALVLNGSTDYVFDTVYDGISSDLTTGPVRSLVSSYINSNNSGKLLYVTPSAGGASYAAATTTMSANGGCTWAGTALISAGVIVGVRTTSRGAGCSGATVVTATDSAIGTGATFTVASTPQLPLDKPMFFVENATFQVLATGGGATTLVNTAAGPLVMGVGAALNLLANGVVSWRMATPPILPYFAIGSLPPSSATTCTAPYSGGQAFVTGSVSGKWSARCDGTNWIAPDGATIN